MVFGVLGSGTWATAIAKMLTDNGNHIHWLLRDQESVAHLSSRGHNPKYLSSVHFDLRLLTLHSEAATFFRDTTVIILAVPSAYLEDYCAGIGSEAFRNKKVISAIKGVLPTGNRLVNDYLKDVFGVDVQNFFTIMGPCHAEEVAAEKLSYLTFSGSDLQTCRQIADHFAGSYLRTVVNNDVYGVQYAAVLKNIYALGAGIAHGLEYGDNFQSVLIANCADEMAGFLKKVGIRHIEVGTHDPEDPVTHLRQTSYAASVYLGDLLVTCYSLYSRNRTFGNMIGKGYSVRTAQLEMNMVAEGYNASRSIYAINQKLGAEMPIATSVYQILWEKVSPREGFREIEKRLI